MFKEMIPGDTLMRRMALRSGEHQSNERPTIQSPPSSDAGCVKIQYAAKERQEWCLRLATDFDNFKRRTARENARRAVEQENALVRDLLPVVDNLERALGGGSAQSLVKLLNRVKQTSRLLTGVLNQRGFTGRDDQGQPFDPQFHEVVGVRTDPMHADQAILDVWQRGWLRGEELFRPAKVVVNNLKRDLRAGHHQNIHNPEAAHHG